MYRGPCLLSDVHVRWCSGHCRILLVCSAADARHEGSLPSGSSPLGAVRRQRRATGGEAVRHPAIRQPHDWEVEEVEAVQVRPRRQDAPAHGRPAGVHQRVAEQGVARARDQVGHARPARLPQPGPSPEFYRCPRCKARPGQPCRAPSGRRPRQHHSAVPDNIAVTDETHRGGYNPVQFGSEVHGVISPRALPLNPRLLAGRHDRSRRVPPEASRRS
jgi:hypothetical protein